MGITVADDGRGIPPIALERVFTTLHYGSTAGGGQRTHVHAGMHGLGAAVVGALSSVVEVVVERDGRRWQQLFVQGEPVSELLDVAPTERRGTSVRFVPDRAIFDSVDVDEALAGLAAPLRDLAHLNPGLRMRIGDTHLDGGEGLISLARTLCGAEPYRELVASGTHEGVQVEVAVCWGARGTCTIGWGNQLPTVGSHLDGLERALERFGDREGRVALVAVMLQAPRFSGRTRRTLEVDAAREAVEAVIAAAAAGPQGARRA